jgi:hypothetical protein
MVALTPAHDAVLLALDWLPADVEADAALVAALLATPTHRRCKLEVAGDLVSATGGCSSD